MRKYISKSVSFDPELFAKMESRLERLRPRINRSNYIEKLILDDLARIEHTGDTSIVAEQAAVYGGKITNHYGERKGRKKK